MQMRQVAMRAEPECTPTERRSVRRYQLELGGALVAYIALLTFSLKTVDDAHGPLKIVLATLPMVGVVAMALALVRFTLRADDLQRQTILVAGAIAALCCAVISMLFGFLENAGFPRLSMMAVWPMVCVAFGIAMPIVRQRYR